MRSWIEAIWHSLGPPRTQWLVHIGVVERLAMQVQLKLMGIDVLPMCMLCKGTQEGNKHVLIDQLHYS